MIMAIIWLGFTAFIAVGGAISDKICAKMDENDR